MSSDEDWGEQHERDGLRVSNDASEGWSGTDIEDLVEKETQ